MVDATTHDVVWCQSCGQHQAMRDLDGICPVCDPGGAQALSVQTKTAAALANADAIDAKRAVHHAGYPG